jgi:mannose-6-phosphate isomerase-like protein (cupin superfamily)
MFSYVISKSELAKKSWPGYFESYSLFTDDNTPILGCTTMYNVHSCKQYLPADSHDDNEGFYVISGQGSMLIGESESDISAGTAILVPAGVSHAIRCTGDEPLHIFIYHFPKDKEGTQ